MTQDKLYFSEGGNSKLPGYVTSFSLVSGWSCPGAKNCLCRADADTGKLTDGKHQQFRCFSATQEAAFPNVRERRWKNFTMLTNAGGTRGMVKLILKSLPDFIVMRLHIAGDFFSQAYLDAWIEVARLRPKHQFYAYTKSLPFWVKRLETIPANLRLVASRGGKYDALIDAHDLPCAEVVFHPDEAEARGLAIDHDDSLARDPAVKRFALLLHGCQPAGSEAAAALRQMKESGVAFGYGGRK